MNFILIILLTFLVSFFSTHFLLKKIREIMIYKQLINHPNKRSSHKIAVPNLGGIAFFILLIISFYFFDLYDNQKIITGLIPGLVILFFIGLKDDLMELSPLKKLLAQLIAAFFFTFHNKNELHFHGFLGLENFSIWTSIVICTIFIVVIINILNLIDGIDGLASIVSINIFITFCVFFYIINFQFLFLVGILLIASLIAFLRLNFSKDSKIFMGDTGSMIIGFVIGVFCVQFMSLNQESYCKLVFLEDNIPLVIIFILFIPLFDTSRIFIVRILNKRSPFEADRLHIHHLLLDYYNLTHKKASIYIGLFHLLFLTFFLGLTFFISQFALIIVFSILLIMLWIYFYSIYKPIRYKRNRIKLKKKINLR